MFTKELVDDSTVHGMRILGVSPIWKFVFLVSPICCCSPFKLSLPRLPARHAARVQEWLLRNRDRAPTHAETQALMVLCGAVQHASVIPESCMIPISR